MPILNREFSGCNLCQSKDFKLLCTKFGRNLVRCKNCGLIYAHPRLSEKEIITRYDKDYLFNEYLPIFQAGRDAYDLELINRHYFLYLSLLDQFHKPGKKLLDVGCGAGFFLKAAEARGWRAEGVEISEAAAQYAREIVGVDVYTGKIEEMHFSPESFDVVTLLDTIEHLLNPLESLKIIFSLLKNDGALIINTPDLKSLSRFFLGLDWAVLSPYEHLYNFNRKNLTQIITKAHFNILCVKNLIHFNPEYTHNKNSMGYNTWKKSYTFLASRRIFKKLQELNQKEILLTANRTFNEKNPALFKSTSKALIYKLITNIIKGDTLIAVAVK